MMNAFKQLSLFLFLTLPFLLGGCRLSVSLTGGNVDPRAKTIYIATFANNTVSGTPSLSQDFTTALINKIQSQTPLAIINQQTGDYSLEGEITGYTITPVAIQGNDVAAMNRLTISVKVQFENSFDETQNFEQTFTRYVDYSSSQNFSSIEDGLISDINDVLTDDIFNKAFVNW